MLSNVEKYKVAIIGSGPAGLSAAGRAAELGVSHILLEGTGEISNTINFWYQKGKHVMNEPAQMPLRSSVGFKEGTREEVLEEWLLFRVSQRLPVPLAGGIELARVYWCRQWRT